MNSQVMPRNLNHLCLYHDARISEDTGHGAITEGGLRKQKENE